ncbi:hypothetical protein GCM10018962_77120 [Dactylosporangium matsuzakiense]|uniref:hypothetical protein n=1 Tax=Dactylosporangium matsuzakiense TaxID=53360 RepID=UPI0031EC4A5C
MTFDEFLDLLPAPHTVTVEPYGGGGAYGDVFGPPAAVRCFVDQKRRLVRAPDGSRVVSSSTVYAPLETVAPARSRITLPDGQTTLVISVARRTAAGLPHPEHVEIVCE